MPLTSWITLKYAPSVAITIVPALNTFVHVVMYFYYYQASLGVQWNWIKRYITTMQLIQFAIITIHAIHMLVMPVCEYPKWFACFELAHGLFFMYMFSQFYMKEYTKSNATSHDKSNVNINNTSKID